ncbi:MAG: transporter substrate-binding domain-containing protein [Burkholderiaceae bacterium]
MTGCITVALALAGATVVQAETLRVCLDPDNLPFSKQDGDVPGMYTELADLVGEKLGMTVERIWWLTHYQKRAMRNTLLKGHCDATFAVPAGKSYRYRTLDRTEAFVTLSYAVVGPKDLKFNALTDLKSYRIGMQFGTIPQVLLATEGGYDTTTYKTSDEVFDALIKSEVDVAFLWGPVAGYDNQTRHGGRFKVVPLSGTDLQGELAVGVRKDHPDLKAKISHALAELKPQIAALKLKYHMPSGGAVNLDHLTVTAVSTNKEPVNKPAGKPVDKSAESNSAATSSPAAAQTPSTAQASSHQASSSEKPTVALDPVAAGRVIFNDVCAHCHATDGASAIRARDLRRIRKRHYDDWLEVTRTTINNGLPDYGMPKWGGVMPEKNINLVIEFLKTIQL